MPPSCLIFIPFSACLMRRLCLMIRYETPLSLPLRLSFRSIFGPMHFNTPITYFDNKRFTDLVTEVPLIAPLIGQFFPMPEFLNICITANYEIRCNIKVLTSFFSRGKKCLNSVSGFMHQCGVCQHSKQVLTI